MWRKGNTCTLLVLMKIGTASVDNSMDIHQKIKNKSTNSSASPHLVIYPKKAKTSIRKDFIATLVTIAKIWKQAKCP